MKGKNKTNMNVVETKTNDIYMECLTTFKLVSETPWCMALGLITTH